MKTIVYCDRANPSKQFGYCPPYAMKRTERIQAALNDLRHTGNICIFYERNQRKPLELIAERVS